MRSKTGITMDTLAMMKKKTGDELQQFFHFKRRYGVTPIKKGKGSYNRRKSKEEVKKMSRGDID